MRLFNKILIFKNLDNIFKCLPESFFKFNKNTTKRNSKQSIPFKLNMTNGVILKLINSKRE